MSSKNISDCVTRKCNPLHTKYKDDFFDLKISLFGIYYHVGDETMISDVFLATSTKDALLAFNQLVDQYKSKNAPIEFLENVSLVALEAIDLKCSKLCDANEINSLFKVVDFVKES